MAHFINFEEEVGRIRTNITKNVEDMMDGDPVVDCRGKGIMISTNKDEGEYDVSTIFQEMLGTTVCLKTSVGVCVDFSELNTDDMIAIYEFLFNVFNPEEAV